MATSNQICALCDHNYDSESRKPLVLPCGHSFCKDCFRKMENSGNCQCPVCRTDWSNQDVDSLPVCYQLLPEPVDNGPFICEEHNNHMTIWCTTCEERCCLICLYMNHPGCLWKPVQTEMDELQGKIEEIQMRAERNVSKNKGKLRASREAVSMDLRALKMLKNEITQAERLLEDQLSRLDIIEMEISQSTVQLTAPNDPDGKDLLQNLKAKVSSLQGLQLNEPDWPSLSMPAVVASVIQCYRKRNQVSVLFQEIREFLARLR